MFIFSKKNFLIRRADGSEYRIAKEYTGEIPEDIAQSRLVQNAVKGGSIVTPAGHSDKKIEAAVKHSDKAVEAETEQDNKAVEAEEAPNDEVAKTATTKRGAKKE